MTTKTALLAGSIALVACAQTPFGFGHRPRFFFAPPNEGAGGDGGTDAGQGEAPSLADMIGDAFDEASAADAAGAADTNNGDADRAAAEQAAAVAADKGNRQETPAATADKAPATPDPWTDADAAKLAALSPEVQNLVAKRIASVEAEATQKVAADVELAGGIRQIVEKNGLSDMLRESGMSEVQGVEYLANLERFARTKPAEYLAFVANHVRDRFGVDPAKVLGLAAKPADGQPGAQQPQEEPVSDPRLDRLAERLDAQDRRAAEATARRVYEGAGQQVATFRDAKDADGKPLRPRFAAVEADMARLVLADPKLTLEDAYDRAVWSNPTVRAQVQAEERAATERKARSEAANAAKAAKANIRAGQRPTSAAPNIRNSNDAVRAALDGIDL